MGTYYADYYNEIPLGIVNKRVCGVGASSFALENSNAVVLVVPNVSMIENKIAQYPNLRRQEQIFGLFNGVDLSTLNYYLTKVKVPKIMVTFDSFHKLEPFIDDSFHIIVDEFQDVLDGYAFRGIAIRNLLNSVVKFSKLSFISSTPIAKEYLPTELQHLPYTELEWDNLSLVNVRAINTTKPLNAVLNIIDKYKMGLVEIGGIKSNAAYFYVNSISLIEKIIDNAGLMPREVRVICANTKRNQSTLGDAFEIETSLAPEKMFNFITSTSFKGSDIYSDTGIGYIISSKTHIYTLLTISTDVYQIAGRIRTETNPFRNLIFHIFSSNPLDLTDEQFETLVQEKTERSNDWLDLSNQSSENQHKAILIGLKASLDHFYLTINQDQSVFFDELKVLLDKRRYNDIVKVYQSGISIINNYKADKRFNLEMSKKLEFMTKNNIVLIGNELYDGKLTPEQVEDKYPILAAGYRNLGKERLKALEYKTTKIRNELDLLNNKDLIESSIRNLFKPGFYSNAEVKLMLKRLYVKLEIKRSATTSNLNGIVTFTKCRKQINYVETKGIEVQ